MSDLLVERRGAVAILANNDPSRNRMTLAVEREAVHATIGAPDQQEGMLAFLQKRKPLFNRE